MVRVKRPSLGMIALAGVMAATLPLAAAESDPFTGASIAPPDATAFVHVENAARWRGELADRPIARWIDSTLTTGEFGKAWSDLAKSVGVQPGVLFDRCLGSSFTLVIRTLPSDQGTENTEWALLTTIPQDVSAQLLRQTRARVREPRFGMAVNELPEQAMLIAREDDRMLVGPVAHPGLFDDVMQRLAGNRLSSLIDEPMMKRARELGEGSASIILRHEPPMGGWSVAVAELHGEKLDIRHAANFDASPFMHGVTRLTCDFSPVLAFENEALLAVGQPIDAANGPLESFIAASVGERLINRATREGLGDRRLTVFCEPVEGQAVPTSNLPGVSVASCLELKDDQRAVAQLEKQLERVASRNDCLAKGAFLNDVPCAAMIKTQIPRETAPSPTATWFAGGFPVMETLKLNWTVAEGPQGAWFVIAGHPRTMNSVAAVLRGPCAAEPGLVGRFDNCGAGNGVRISTQILELTEQAEQIAQPGRIEELRHTLGAMSELAAGLQNCRWQLARPSANEMRLDVQITLTPPESARDE